MDLIPLELSHQFECANAEKVRRVGPTSFTLSTRPDCAEDNEQYRLADYYVAFRLINRNPERIAASVAYSEHDLATGRTFAVRNVAMGSAPRVEDWRPLPREGVNVLPAEGVSALALTVEARSMLDVTSMYWMSSSQVMKRLAEIGRKWRQTCRVYFLGKTAQGRDIPVVDFSPLAGAGTPICVVGATAQSHELGTIAVMGILEAILEGRCRQLVGQCRLMLLPLTNPDGNALGTCMTNSLGQNVFFGFGEAGTGRAAMECEAIWEFVVREQPAFYLEFHSYPHLNRPSFRAYDLDLALFPDERSRSGGEVFFAAVKQASPNPPVALTAGTDSEQRFRTCLISKALRELGVPATLYKLHNRETIDANRRQALTVFEHVTRAMCASA